MKKLLFKLMPILGFVFVGNLSAQNVKCVNSTPALISAASDSAVTISGISSDGHFCWGEVDGNSELMYYDLLHKKATMIATKEGEGSKMSILGVSPDETIFYVDNGRAIILKGKKATYLKSPNNSFNEFRLWGMTPDGSQFVGNIADSVLNQLPFVSSKMDNGNYELITLPIDSMDGLGAKAQYSQVRGITPDGKYIYGNQLDNTGFISRLLVWSKDDNGEYTLSTPLDELQFDLTKEKPGTEPVWEEYVTATDDTSEEYEEQEKAFDKADSIWREKFKAYTKNSSSVYCFAVQNSTFSDHLCTIFVDRMSDDRMIPITYDCKTGKYILYKNHLNYVADNILPNKDVLAWSGNINVGFDIIVIHPNGSSESIQDWIKKQTGTDITSFFSTREDPNTNQSFLCTGLPYFSADGKSLILSAYNIDTQSDIALYLNFDKPIYSSQTDAVPTIVGVQAAFFDGKNLIVNTSGDAIVNLYNSNGICVGTYPVHSQTQVQLQGKYPNGVYVAAIEKAGKIQSQIKLIIK